MSCEELKDLYELHALGALDPDERRDLDEHLTRGCPNCVRGVREARHVAASLAYSAPEQDPPARLRARVIAAVSPPAQRESGWSWITHAWATVALVLLIAVVWYGYTQRRLSEEVANANRRLAQLETLNNELAARNKVLAEAMDLIALPESRQLVFGATEREPPRGRVWVNAQRGVVLMASRLPEAPAGKIYEMWIVPKQGAPVPAGLFHSSPRGVASHVWLQPVDLAAAAAVAVTLEPEAGSPAPTSTPLIVAKL
jgi:anti-sigma-K factor RskA